jgi:hypothetical protein
MRFVCVTHLTFPTSKTSYRCTVTITESSCICFDAIARAHKSWFFSYNECKDQYRKLSFWVRFQVVTAMRMMMASGMFNPDDEGSKYNWNVSQYLPDYTEQHPGRQSSPIFLLLLLEVDISTYSIYDKLPKLNVILKVTVHPAQPRIPQGLLVTSQISKNSKKTHSNIPFENKLWL